MRYVQVEFRPGGTLYSYSYAGHEPIEPGVDRVEIDTRDGRYVFRVKGVLTERPDTGGRAIKPIIRLMPRS